MNAELVLFVMGFVVTLGCVVRLLMEVWVQHRVIEAMSRPAVTVESGNAVLAVLCALAILAALVLIRAAA